MKNDGKDAEAAFEAYWRGKGAIVDRFFDAAALRGLNGGKAVKDFPKPADYILTTSHGDISYAEVKSTVDPVRFSFGCLQKGQSSMALRQAMTVEGRYIFYIFSYHFGRWFLMSCKDYKAARDAGRSSMKFEELTPWRM